MEPISRVVGLLLLLVSPQTSRAQEPCTVEPTFDSFRCRLSELSADTTTALNGVPPQERLLRQLERAGLRIDAGDEFCVAGNTRRARSSMRFAVRGLIVFRHTLALKVGRETVPSQTREQLRNAASELWEDLRIFRAGLVCPLTSTTTTTRPGASNTTTSQTTTSSTTSTTTTIGTSTTTTIATTSTTTASQTTTTVVTTSTVTSTIVTTTSAPATTSTSTTSVTTTTGTPPVGSAVTLVIALTHDPGTTGEVSGVEIALDYDPAKVGIPGSLDDPLVSGRTRNLGPQDVLMTVSDRDTNTDGQDDRLFIPYGTAGILPPGDIVEAIFDGALGATITEADFTCTVVTAVDQLGTPLDGVTCGVSVSVTSSTTTTTTAPVTTTSTTTTVTTAPPTTSTTTTASTTTSAPTTTNTSTTTTVTTTSVTTTTGQAVCGNGVPEGGEECDDGNELNTDACTRTCEDARCGDGFTWQDVEQCDDGNQVNDDFCQNDCNFVPALCGDGVRQFGETCDDHNTADGDDCPPDCRIESCVATGTRHLVGVTFTPPAGLSVGGLVVFIHYPDGTVGIPGLGNATQVRARILNLQSGFTHVSNELDYAIRETIAPTLPNAALAAGEIFRVSFDLCFGATAPPPTSFTCVVESASTPQGGDIDLGLNPITCAVTGT